MAAPATYNRQFNFNEYQALNPASPIPGVQVDIEYNAVKITLDQIINNLGLIQRSDNQLANQSVGFDQLKPEVATLANMRSWITGTSYAIGQAVFFGTNVYRCLSAHISGTFATDLAAGKWQFVVAFTPVQQNVGIVSIAGASVTYDNTQIGAVVARSNAGVAMTDTLPGASAGALTAGGVITVKNQDATGLLQIRVGAGSTLDGLATNFVLLGPQQSASFVYGATDYRTLSVPSRCRIADDGVGITIFVNPAGSDTNSGINASNAFQTIQAAYDFCYSRIDLNTSGVRFKLAHGTYTTGLIASFTLYGWNTSGIPLILLDGDVASPGSVIITDGTSGCILASSEVYLYVQGVTLISTGPAPCVHAIYWAFVTLLTSVIFGAATSTAHIRAEHYGLVDIQNSYAVTAGATNHMIATTYGQVLLSPSAAVVITGTPAFSNAWAFATNYGSMSLLGLYSGGATGPRFIVQKHGLIDTNTGSLTTLPGNSAGTETTSSFGKYL